MKLRATILLLCLFSMLAEATSIGCSSNEANRVISKEVFFPFKAGEFGYQYTFSVPVLYRGQEYKGAVVIVGSKETPYLLFFPHLERQDGIDAKLGGLFYHNSLLKNAELIVEYGDYCGGNGYQVSFKFSGSISGT
ncbi:hypothetical protein AB8S08_05350 [Pseudidiomarina sp. PP-1MA]|uniref:Uncharacterized protein n=1 Tax=Pseudidiomarina sp. PP-1MA TaxID=3237706 RepID=A0AB39XCC0_9GAMM